MQAAELYRKWLLAVFKQVYLIAITTGHSETETIVGLTPAKPSRLIIFLQII